MIETSDVKKMVKIGEYSKSSMLFTLIIPLAFLIFLSASMDSVWSLYLMLQIVCNMTNMIINRPGNADFMIFVGENISSFKITEDKHFLNWVRFDVLDHA